MIFSEQIHVIRRTADAVLMCMGPLERIQMDTCDLRRYDLRTAAQELRDAADRCDAIADRFNEEPVIIPMVAAE